MTRPDTIAELERLRAQQVAIWDSENGKTARSAQDRAQTAIIDLDAEIDRRRAAERGM